MIRIFLRLLPALVLAAVAVGFFASGAGSQLSLSGLSAHAQGWRAAAARDPLESLAIYVAVYAAVTAAGMPVAMGLTIAGGVIFGPIRGGLAAISAASLAAMLGYAAARSALGPVAARWLDRGGGRLVLLVEARRARGFWPILAARLMPVMPFPLVNYAAGMARVPPGAFLGATVIGGLPASFIFATLGAGVGVDFSAAGISQAVRSPLVWGPLLALSVLSAVPIFLRHRGRGTAGESSVI